MKPLENRAGLSLAMAVWLAHDDYTSGQDEHPGENLITATALLRPTRQIVLAPRVPDAERSADVGDRVAMRFGHAIHDSIEMAWRRGYRQAMTRLGYPRRTIDRVRINPCATAAREEGIIPVYLEQRAFRPITVDGVRVIVSGKFDQVIDGELNDTKTTSVHAWINRTKEDDYRIQGSIYRWLNPERITSDIMRVQHVFTDWQGFRARSDPDYPPGRLVEFPLTLMSLAQTEAWIARKIREILANQDLPEPEILRCTDRELWRAEPVFKYYADPEKAQAGGRSTRNFPDHAAAAAHAAKQGKGVVVTVPGRVRACGYCPAFPACSQKDAYEHGEP